MQRFKSPKILILGLLVVIFAGTSCSEFIDDLPTLSKADLRAPDLAETSKIFDTDGTLIRILHGVENRTIVPLSRIPKKAQRAVIAIEDERFWSHDGVDIQAIFRAFFANVSSGKIEEGGSTITQQYVKNVIISPGETADKTLQRKIDEAVLSRQLEEALSKKEILQRYLNTVYFGNGAYGIQAAARTYFRKPAKKLTLAESALLAAVIKAPDTYNPYLHKKAATKRRDVVLVKMVSLGKAGEKAADRAMKGGLGLKKKTEDTEYPAPYFIDYVHRLIEFDEERFGMHGKTAGDRERALFTGGLRIHTTVDLDIQAAADEAVDYYLGPETGPHGSLVAIDPETGYVKAMVGGFDFFADEKKDPSSQVNLAIQAEPNLGRVKDCGATKYEIRAPGCGRQAGSAYKPFALTSALDQGIPLSRTYEAKACMDFPAYDNWTVCNYEKSEYGEKTLLEGTVASINTVYAQVAIEAGFENVVEMAEAMGITIHQDAYASSVLGTNSVNPLNMASAYGTLAAQGVHHPPIAITKIQDAEGKVLYEDKTESVRVVEAPVAYVATTALEEVITSGTGTNAALLDGRPVAGKTGTAQEYRDAWFGGYIPQLVAAVWVGHPEGQISMASEYAGGPVFGGSFPAQIFSRFMSQAVASEGFVVEDFVQPPNSLINVEIDTDPPSWAPLNGCLAGPFTPEEDRDYVLVIRGTEPDSTCREENETVTVPDVSGWASADDAEAVLEGAGFSVDREAEATDDYPPGTVISQFPEGGSQAPYGSTVTITVATGGKGNGTVPAVLGLTVSVAEDRLVENGYVPNVITESESGGGAKKNSGIVWKQEPSSGTEATPGSTVTIYANP
ncbi:MAG TPA: transglycosylase domain-containing protein [Actinomycetota bacterium]|nr:transglycosylase domain-containing protein [Actinomycetota bacterium]